MNNYHTQVNGQNVLNQVANEHKLLQQMQTQPQMGTPIQQIQYTPQQLAQMQQLYQQQQAQAQLQSQNQASLQIDELELSERDITPLEEEKSEKVTTKTQAVPVSEKKEINNGLNKIKSTSKKQVQKETPKEDTKEAKKSSSKTVGSGTKTVITEKESDKKSKIVEYAVIPILLLVIFIVLLHPKTSGLLSKYLPPITTNKGILYRAGILAVSYILITFVTGMF